MERSKFSFQQIIQYCFDAASGALRVRLVPVELNFELSHQKGDSVKSVPLHKTLKGKGTLDISDCRKFSVYGGSVKISPDPKDDIWYDVSEGTHDMCACRVMSDSDSTYIVARS